MTKAKTKAQAKDVSVTIARIEAQVPCWKAYSQFLRKVNGPVPSAKYRRAYAKSVYYFCDCRECVARRREMRATIAAFIPSKAKTLAINAPISVLAIRRMRVMWYEWVWGWVLTDAEKAILTEAGHAVRGV